MERAWSDRTYFEWEARPAFTTKDGRQVHPLYTPGVGRDGSQSEQRIWAYDIWMDPEDPDLEHSLMRDHRVGFLHWAQGEIGYVDVVEGWKQQGVATEMLRLARGITPGLRHSSTQRTGEAHLWIAAVDPHESWPRKAT